MIAEHVLAFSISPSGKDEQLKAAAALARLAAEDAMLGVGSDPESGETVVYGAGEIHLQLVRDRLRREFGVSAAFGSFRVVYREAIREPVREEATFIRRSGGRRQFARCVLALEPLAGHEGFEFSCALEGMPPRFAAQVERGVREALERGPIGGFPLVGIKATLVGGSFVEGESDEMSFKIAGAMALRSGSKKAHPMILEPIMKCEVVCPEKYLSGVVGELKSRRAKFVGMSEGPVKTVRWAVPLSEMLGFADNLRGITSGNASFMLEPGRFEEIPLDMWKASNDPHSPDEPPAAGAGRPVKPTKPKPGLSGGRGKTLPPRNE